jgi:hypothetical protein
VHGEYFGDAARGQVGEGEVVAGGALRLGDAAHNIRSALNHFAWAAVRSPNWQTMFCVWGQAARRRRGSGAGSMAKALGHRPSLQAAVLKPEPWPTGHNPRASMDGSLDFSSPERAVNWTAHGDPRISVARGGLITAEPETTI